MIRKRLTALTLLLAALAPGSARADEPNGEFDYSFDSIGLSLRLQVGRRAPLAERLRAGLVLGLRENLRWSPLLPCQERCETAPAQVHAIELSPHEVAAALDRLRNRNDWQWQPARLGPR